MRSMHKRDLSLICILFVVSVFTGCHREEKARSIPLAPKKVDADTMVVKAMDIPVFQGYPGHVQPKVHVVLRAKIPGYVKAVYKDEGDMVKKGELLLRLDDVAIRSKLKALRDERQALIREKNALEADLSYAKANFERIKGLFHQDAATKDEFDRAREGFLSAKERVKAYAARIEAVRAKLASLQNELQYVDVKSPVTGWLVKKAVDKGSFAGPGALLFEMDSMEDGYWFVAELDEALLDRVHEGQMVYVSIGGGERPLAMKITTVVPQVDPTTHTFSVKVDLKDPGLRSIQSGMFGRLYLKKEVQKGILIPYKTIISRGGIKGVFVVDASNEVHWRVLKIGGFYLKKFHEFIPVSKASIGPKDEDLAMALVASGLEDGDRIVTTGLAAIRGRMRVE